MRLDHTFPSIRNYLIFCAAKTFQHTTGEKKEFATTPVERFSQQVLLPFSTPVDLLCKNINKPIILVAANVIGVVATTVFFYPDLSFKTIQMACSPIIDLQPWMLKFGTYIASEIGITGLMIRTLARLNQQDLLTAWEKKEVVPIHYGMELG